MSLESEVNTLLRFLRDFHAVQLVRTHFVTQHGNTAPGLLLADQVARLEGILDERTVAHQKGVARVRTQTADPPRE